MTITLNTNLLILLCILLGELATVLQWALGANLIPAKWVPWIVVGIGVVPKLTAVLAHYSNPNGSSAALPWVRGTREILSAAEAAYEAYRAMNGGNRPLNGAVSTGSYGPIGAPMMPFGGLPGWDKDVWQAVAGAAKASPDVS